MADSDPISEGKWLVEWADGRQYDGINPIDVYMHPAAGLCVWFEDYAGRGGIDIPASTCGDGHVPVGLSGLRFVRRSSRGCTCSGQHACKGSIRVIDPGVSEEDLSTFPPKKCGNCRRE